MNKISKLLTGSALLLFTATANAEYFLSAYAKELNTEHFPKVSFNLLVHDFNDQDVLKYAKLCAESPSHCYKINIYEHNAGNVEDAVNAIYAGHPQNEQVLLSARSVNLINSSTDVLEVSYKSSAKMGDDIHLTITIDTNGFHNGRRGNTYSFSKAQGADYQNKSDYSDDGEQVNFDNYR